MTVTKSAEKYSALKIVFAQIKVETGTNMHKVIAPMIYHGRKDPIQQFRNTLSPKELHKNFTEIQWEIIFEEIQEIDTKYMTMFFQLYLGGAYGLTVIDQAAPIDHAETNIEEIRMLADTSMIETADVLRATVKHLSDGDLSDDDREVIQKEAREAIEKLSLLIAKTGI